MKSVDSPPKYPAPAPSPASAPSPAPAPQADSPLTVTTKLSPDPSHIGDLLTLELVVVYPRDHSVNLPSGLSFAPLKLVDVREGGVESTGKNLRRRFWIDLQYFEVGEAEVPSFRITWIDPSEAVHTHTVPPQPFEVQSLLDNESDPERRGEDPPISLEYPNVRAATIIYSVLAGVALASVLLFLFFTWRRRERPVVLPPPPPPHERALADLHGLAREREELIEADRYQDYYLRLTEIAKRYLGARFGFEALDRTTEEIQDLLGRGAVNIAPLDPKQVIAFLQDCDLVKFARLAPPEDEAREALQVVREMVERSRPREQPGSSDEAESTAGATEAATTPAASPREPSERGAEPRDPDEVRATRPEPPKPGDGAPPAPEAPNAEERP